MNIASLLAKKGPKVITVQPEQTIRQALGLLADHNIGALVVVDRDSRPVGILSERDIVRSAARDEDVFVKTVSALMTKDVILGVPQDDLESVGRIEAIRGTASSLYGNASGGVIDIRSAPPPADPISAQVRSWFGAYHSRRFVGSVGGRRVARRDPRPAEEGVARGRATPSPR